MPLRTQIRLFAAALLACLLLPAPVGAKSRRKKASTAQFSYYLLALSYAPDFCNQSGVSQNPAECGSGRHVGFVVHGLWPQQETSTGPANCGPASPVSQAIVQATLAYIPTASLIQHEWATHGTCTGLSAADYFALLRKARDSVTLPADLSQPTQNLQLSPAQIESKIATANPTFPKGTVRTSCYPDKELQEVRICLNKDLSPRACSVSAGECTATSLTLLPVR